MAATDFTRWFLALFFPAVAAFYTLRILAAKHRRRASPVFAGRPGSLHFATHATFRAFRVLILVVCLGRLVWPDLDRYLGPFDALWHRAVLVSGVLLLLGGFLAILYIHFYMGEDWRSGTRAEERTRLITTGPFAVSRNPMMLAVLASQLGLFLALPSLFTLICLGVGVWAVHAQVILEERVLRDRFGGDYDRYAAATPRWLFRVRPQR